MSGSPWPAGHVGHRAEDREGDLPFERPGGNREVPRRVAVGLGVVGLEVERDEVHAGADPVPEEPGDELIAVHPRSVGVDPQHVEVPGRGDVLGDRRDLERLERAERFVVALSDGRAALEHGVGLLQLRQSDGGCEVGHVVLEPRSNDLITPGISLFAPSPGVPTDAMEALESGLPGDVGVVGEQHPTLTGGDRLGRVEGEAHGGTQGCVQRGADRSTPIGPGERVRGILDDRQVVGGGQRGDAVEIAGDAADVDGQNRGGPVADSCSPEGRGQEPLVACGEAVERLFQGISTDVEGGLLHVHEDRDRADLPDHLSRRGKGVRRRHHEVARSHPERFERQVKRGRSRVEGDGVSGSDGDGDGILHLATEVTGCQPAAQDRLSNGVGLLHPHIRARQTG